MKIRLTILMLAMSAPLAGWAQQNTQQSLIYQQNSMLNNLSTQGVRSFIPGAGGQSQGGYAQPGPSTLFR